MPAPQHQNSKKGGGKLVKQDTSGTVTSMPTGKKKAELTLLKALSPPATPEPKGKRAQLDARANVNARKEDKISQERGIL